MLKKMFSFSNFLKHSYEKRNVSVSIIEALLWKYVEGEISFRITFIKYDVLIAFMHR